MPKLKTNKSVQKRVRVTKSGKFKKMRAGRRHLLEGKSPKRKRHMRKSDLVSSGMEKQLRRLMPYA
ncbi:MAG TPA: 50S ribosomal protein L35 [Candidatus Omnitrophota bacterium]|nr:50S ribosomal protein L35 [Candidatus Omnitrophota bacterium]